MIDAGPHGSDIPEEVRSLFWDADIDEGVIARSPAYIIERVLEEGSPLAIRWLRRRYGDGTIGDVVRRSKRLSRRTANYWGLFLRIPTAEIECLNRPSTATPEPFS